MWLQGLVKINCIIDVDMANDYNGDDDDIDDDDDDDSDDYDDGVRRI